METKLGDLFTVTDEVIVVTGGLGLLGREFSRTLAQAGAKVVVLDVEADPDAVRNCLGELADNENAMFLSCDVTSRASVEQALQEITARWGVPDGLINNAALDAPPNAPVAENGPFESYPESSWDKVMEVNVKGVFLASQVFGANMAKLGRGSIVNINSIYGLVSPDQRVYEYRRKQGHDFFKPVSYSVSKSALLNLTRYLATYWGERNVRVNSLTFGGVYNHQDDEFVRHYSARVPLGRMARADEYNGALLFLLSEASSYMTGANLVIDGGWTAW